MNCKKNQARNFSLRSNAGTIMVGIVVLIVLSAIAFSTAMYVLGDAIRIKREILTMERLRAVETALIGHPHAFLNEATSQYGYLSRQNALTTTIGNLVDLQDTITGLPADQDAYGNAIQLSNNAGTYSIYSIGNNDTDESGGGDDIAIQFPSATRTSVDISVMIVDATQSGHTALTFSGVTNPMMNNSYIYDENGNDLIDGPYDGHAIFGPVYDGVLASSDISVTLHSAPGFETVAGVAPDRFDRATASFQWDDIPVGVHMVRIQGNPDDSGFDPQWAHDVGGVPTTGLNRLFTPLLINPTPTAVRKQFNVVYPIVAATTTVSGGWDHTVTDHGNEVFDALSDSDTLAPREYLAAGYGSPDNYEFNPFSFVVTRRRMRSLLNFDLTAAALPGISSTSKVTFARLRLSTHTSSGSFPGAPCSADPTGAGTIQIYRYKRAWAEASGFPDIINPGWVHVNSSPDDYEELIASFSYTSASFQNIYELDVVYAVQNWIDGEWNKNGFLILNTNDTAASGDNWWCFKSSETGTAGTEPTLIVSYYR